MVVKSLYYSYETYLRRTQNVFDPTNKFTDIVMFDGSPNVQLVGQPLNVHYQNLMFMRGFEHTESLLLNGVSKIPMVNPMITSHKEICNIFSSSIYHKYHSIFK